MPMLTSCVVLLVNMGMPSSALQLQKQADDSNAILTRKSGRTTELEWVWAGSDSETCDTACANLCSGAVCSNLDRAEIDSAAKLMDLEAEMGTSVCTTYLDSTITDGPLALNGECYANDANTAYCDTSAGTYSASVGGQFLCACEITLGTCSIAEDPHIHVFDEAQVSLLLAGSEAKTDDELIGEQWLVKSDRVKVQARFENLGGSSDNKVFTRAVAFGGEILNDNVITVGSLEDPITWNGKRILNDQQSSFYMREGSFFINATRGASSLVQDPSQENLGVNIRLASGVSMIVNRLHHYTNVAIRMPQQAGGQEGLCGNFNGVGADDSVEMMNDRFNPKVTPEESLFVGVSYN